jgi:hypothetical protein
MLPSERRRKVQGARDRKPDYSGRDGGLLAAEHYTGPERCPEEVVVKVEPQLLGGLPPFERCSGNNDDANSPVVSYRAPANTSDPRP